MSDATDMDLVREFAERHSETAFAELVRRHLNLVYSVALRFAGNAADAEDIAQAVFVILARKAAALRNRTVLTGWMYETTRLAALQFLRNRARRHEHEQEAHMESQLQSTGDAWPQLAPLLEQAMSRLSEKDRTLLALRYFENRSNEESAALLGIGEWAARKRSARALEKLRNYFSKRGVNSTTAIIAGAISTNCIRPAPATLVGTVTATAVAKGSVAGTMALVKGTLKLMLWAKTKTILIGGAAAVFVVGTAELVRQEIQARKDKMQVFAAEGHLSTVFYRSQSDTNEFIKTEGKVLFLYSNDVWRTQFTYEDHVQPKGLMPDIPNEKIIGQIMDDKRVPDGMREILVPPPSVELNPKVMTAAMVQSNQFPSWGSLSFVPWLSLSPNPELPLLDSNRIHFAFQPELYGNPQNEGGFFAKYIEPEKRFLSELIVSNNGVGFGPEGRIFQYPGAYTNGFVQFSYRVLETTNCNGMIFPLKAVLSQFTPAMNGQSPEDLFAVAVTEFNIQKIDVGGRHLTFAPIPNPVLALDSRPPGLNKDITMNYLVTNDQYLALTNERMEKLARIYRQAVVANRKAQPRRQ
jgi:RNA polymerase sigma factor (sigma-70 family)